MRARSLPWMVALWLVACGGEPPESGVPETATSTSQWSETLGTQRARTTVWLVLVDDAPTQEARTERERVPAWLYERGNECLGPNDPAYVDFHDDRVVLVASSQSELSQTSEVHPEWAPGLRSLSDSGLDEARASLASAIADLETAEVEPLRAWDGLEHWRALLAGEAAPTSDEERRFLQDLPTYYEVVALAAVTRDDASQIERLGRTTPFQPWWVAVHAPQDDCANLDEWKLAERLPRLGRGGADTLLCDDSGPFGWASKCGMSCFPVPAPLPDGASEGAVACRVWLTLDADEACVAARGWLDPLDEDGERRIRKVERDGQERRLCEVRQLEGAALQSCRLDPGCSECSAGWCLRDRWTDEQADEWSVRNEGSFCDPEPSPAVALPQFRFTGASDRADGQLEIVCDH